MGVSEKDDECLLTWITLVFCFITRSGATSMLLSCKNRHPTIKSKTKADVYIWSIYKRYQQPASLTNPTLIKGGNYKWTLTQRSSYLCLFGTNHQQHQMVFLTVTFVNPLNAQNNITPLSTRVTLVTEASYGLLPYCWWGNQEFWHQWCNYAN